VNCANIAALAIMHTSWYAVLMRNTTRFCLPNIAPVACTGMMNPNQAAPAI
jgi:hypothetical protein